MGRARERERMALENGATGHIQRNKAATAAEAVDTAWHEVHWKAGFLRGAKFWYGVAQGVPEENQYTMWQSEQRECWAAAHELWPKQMPQSLEDAREICGAYRAENAHLKAEAEAEHDQ